MAQVIPVLLLALIVDTRLLQRAPGTYDRDVPADDPRFQNASHPLALFTLTALIVAGECAALWGASVSEPSRLTSSVAVAGLLSALAAVTGPVLYRQARYFARIDTGRLVRVFFIVIALAFVECVISVAGWLVDRLP